MVGSSAMSKDGIRGLAVFISDIRNCKSREAEVKRVNKELANIRSKFRGDKTLDGYAKKKYVCKLLFIFLLGHDIDFGLSVAVDLLNSNRYSEKHIGYLFISVLISEKNDFMKLIIQNLKQDLSSKNAIYVNLALHCIANVATSEFAEEFSDQIPKLLLMPEAEHGVKQSAALCLLRLLEIRYADLELAGQSTSIPSVTEWANRIVHLLNDQHMGVVTSACSLLIMLAEKNPQDFKACINLAASRLSRIVTSNHADFQDYSYYFVPAPWLCVKLLRLLQCFPPTQDKQIALKINECIEMILNRASEAPKSRKVQHSNAKNAVLFEAIQLIFHMDADATLFIRAANQLGSFLTHKETNLRYMALESLCVLATSEHSRDAVAKHRDTVIKQLKTERDISVRKRAVDLLYAICEQDNAKQIVNQLLEYLENADFSIREELVLKTAILAERYATDYTWYVDTMLTLIKVAGDFVSEEVWYRVVQMVINRDDVQGYAAKVCFEALQLPAAHETMIKVGGYILGEFGNLIARDERSSPKIQLNLLHSRFHLCSQPTRALLLTTYIKFVNLFPEIKQEVLKLLASESISKSSDIELQQRALEYAQLAKVCSTEVLATVLEEMPPFKAQAESSILKKIRKTKPGSAALMDRKSRSGTPSSTISGETGSPGKKPTTMVSVAPAPPKPEPPKDNASMLLDILGDTINTPAPVPTTTAAPISNGLDDLLGGAIDMTTPARNSPMAMPITTAAPNIFDQPMGMTNGLGLTNGVGMTNGVKPPPNYQDVEIADAQKFTLRNSGVLYESDSCQIGIKGEFDPPNLAISMFFGNKTSLTFNDFEISLEETHGHFESFNFDQPAPTFLDAGEQLQRKITTRFCSSGCPDMATMPILKFSYSASGENTACRMRIPIMANKFMIGACMNGEQFFGRWKGLSQPGQEAQVIRAMGPQSGYFSDQEAVSTRLQSAGFDVLANIDPNPNNYVCAGIIKKVNAQVGVLMRLEPNMDTKQFRLTIRTTHPTTSKVICDLLQVQF